MADGLDPARVLRALARPGIGDELHALGVRDLSGYGDDDYDGEAQWPPWNEARIRELVDEAFAGEATRATTTVHPGGARFKEWPRLALEEATRMWVEGAYEHSRNEIAKQVTKKVIADWDEDDMVAHGWDRKPFKFTRDAMDLVVDAIDAGDLEWDAEKGLGVFRKFSATPEWLPIPHRKPAS
jgi:hypothetical protein